MSMMDALEILESLRGLGITVHVVGPDRLRLEPASRIPPEMVPRILEAKGAILEELRSRTSEEPIGDGPSLEAELRFGQSHARLFPFIGRKVRTPRGSGTLLQVFADTATVVLDSDLSRCCFYAPAEIEPIN